MTITYAGKYRPSAEKIAEAGEDIEIIRDCDGDINWGRAKADTSLNPDITNSTNKRKMRELFKENDVPMPRLLTLYEAADYVGEGLDVVGRPDTHSKGRGFWHITGVNAWDDYNRALRGTRRKAAATHFMEFIEAEHEYRVHIFRGKSLRISEKKFDGVDHNNRPVYTTIKPTGSMKYVRRAAKKAVKALGLDFGAVDILTTSDGSPYVLEVNAAPGLGGTMPKIYAEAFRKWCEDEED